MKFKELTKEDKSYILTTYLNKELPYPDKISLLTKKFDIHERTLRKWINNKLNVSQTNISEHLKIAKEKKLEKNSSYFLITWAQNNTPVHSKFLSNLEAYADFLGGNIHVIAGRYNNTTQTLNKDNTEEFWDDSVLKYLDANRHDIHKYLSIMSDIKIQPTAVNPMSGLEGLSSQNSCIFGSPKVQLQMIPVLDGYTPKMMLTTGACTVKNYTDSKAGKKGEFHHLIGFVIVEIVNKDIFHVRQVTADEKTGDFIDLFYKISNSEVKEISKIDAIVLGDIHFGSHDQKVLDNTFKLLDKLEPKHVILHDVFDGYSISHHQMKDPFIQYSKEINGTNDLAKEIDGLMDGLKPFSKYKNVVIVRSNHDDFLDRWLKNEDWKKQPTPKNSALYMELSTKLLKQYGSDINNVKGVIPELINERYPKFITLNENSSYKVNGYELGAHGNTGTNGSRGTLEQFRKLNTKIVVGHYHTPGRKDGVLTVGTSTKLRLGYNNGPSSWLQSHVIIHENGKAQHINFLGKNKEFTTFNYIKNEK